MEFQNSAFTRRFGAGRDQAGCRGEEFLPDRIKSLSSTTDSIVVTFCQPMHIAFTLEQEGGGMAVYETLKFPVIDNNGSGVQGIVGLTRTLRTENMRSAPQLLGGDVCSSVSGFQNAPLSQSLEESLGKQVAENDGRLCLLTERQLTILRLIAQGAKNREVAALLGVSIRTIEKHRQEIRRRLNVDSLPELLRTVAVSSLTLSSSEAKDEGEDLGDRLV
ncbi:MAG: helix-turn-helix transcriptional regulator [Planctomycetales bacterium]|nr:helix-turn-helix transcriptional regulator [Planctomycetales bacterium]